VFGDSNISNFEICRNRIHDNFNELIIYFPSKKGIAGRLSNFISYLIFTIKGIKIIFKESEKIDIVHANILNRSAFPALMLKVLMQIPYVVTEHWSRYLPSAGKAFHGLFRKAIARAIARNASTVMPVSVVLKEAMLQHKLFNKDYEIVHNVVDDFFFETTPIFKNENGKKNILHISCFDDQAKNIGGILRATRNLCKFRDDFRLTLIGTGKDFDLMNAYASQLEFPDGILDFAGEKSPEEVVDFFRNSDFMILFSNFETAGIVIAESLICGKPVISTQVGSATELIDEDTGILIETGNESQLLEAMNRMLDSTEKYDESLIRSKVTGLFEYKNVGNQIYQIYQKAIQSNK
jgi:glycosyltransferase involved in cell wall biosynthesis